MKKYLSAVLILLIVSSVHAQKDFGFTLKAGANFPTGDFSTYYNAGFGGLGGVFYNISENTRVTFTIGYNSWALNVDAFNKAMNENGYTGTFDVTAPIEAIPFLLNVKFFWGGVSKFHPYALLEGGIYKYSRQMTGRYIDGEEIQKINSAKENMTNGSFSLGLGFEYPINEIIMFDIFTKYNIVINEEVYNLGDSNYQTSYSSSNFISIFVGVNIFFGE